MYQITFQGERSEHLTLALYRRAYPEATDFDDGNWIDAVVDVVAGGFKGRASGVIRAEELEQFQKDLTDLQEHLEGTASFRTMEDWITISIEGDGLGHWRIYSVIQDAAGVGNRLDCTIVSDQTYTRSTLTELAAVVNAFPVIGRAE